MANLQFLQQRIDEELKALKFPAYPKELYDPIQYVISIGGKRMRPVLLLMACELFDGDIEKAIKPAMGIELFHNFTLLHDDIMDNAPFRRTKPTVHNKWNANVAILSGDTMFVKSCSLMIQTDDKIVRKVLNTFNDTAIQVCEGQQLDMNFETSNKVAIPQYLKMIELKTAVLLAASLKIGALIGGAREEDAQLLYEFGKNIGIAFQLQDDILDVYGDEEKFGKQKGGDIISNKKTYLLLKSMELASLNRYVQENLQQWIYAPQFDAAEKVEAVTSIYDSLGVRNMAEQEMTKYYEQGLNFLNSIPVHEEKKNELIAFADSLMVRQV